MKRTLSVLIIIVLSLNTTAILAGDDEKVITNVIEQEYQAFLDNDLEAWSDFWVHEPYVSMLWIGSMGYSYVTTFDSLKVITQIRMQGNNPEGPKADKQVKEINISGNMATVFLDEHFIWQYAGQEGDMLMKSKYVLEKVEDKWKFVSMTTFNKTSYENNDLLAEYRINFEGYQFMSRGELDKAIEVFEMNTRLYPEAFNTWDSLAEAYMKKGDEEKAIKFFEKSLVLNPENDNAKKKLEKLEE